MRGSGAEVPAAIWSSERRLTTGNGEGRHNEVRTRGEHNSASRAAVLRLRRPGDAPRSVRREPIQKNAADRSEV